MASRSEKPLIVIVGPTASGKTALAVELASMYGGEIICADSRTIYKGMDIGTAKPTQEEMHRVPHWGLNLLEPGDHFTAADFKHYAERKIDEIRSRGNIPFLVGGTGLYIDAVLFNYQFGSQADTDLRLELNKLSIEDLHEYCFKNNILLPENKYNKRYVVRAIEQKSINNKRDQVPISTSIIVGISTDRTELRTRITHRIEQLFKNGVVDESIKLGKKYGWNNEAMTGNIYPIIHSYLEGKASLDEIKEKATTTDWRLAKRQMTWFKRNQHIHWLSLEEAREYIQSLLATE